MSDTPAQPETSAPGHHYEDGRCIACGESQSCRGSLGLTPHEKLEEARRLTIEATREIREQQKAATGAEHCQCGHRRDAQPLDAVAVIQYRQGGQEKQWSLGAAYGRDTTETLRAHLATWLPDAEFLSCTITPVMHRYDLVTNYRAGSVIEEMEHSDDGEWVRWESVQQHIEGLTRQQQWQPIETAPKDSQAMFWVRPKYPHEAHTDTSGRPIVSGHAPRLHIGHWKSWSALETATHWQPLPAPPAAPTGQEAR